MFQQVVPNYQIFKIILKISTLYYEGLRKTDHALILCAGIKPKEV